MQYIKSVYIYIRYLIYRYFIGRKFKSHYLYYDSQLLTVNESIFESSFFGYYNISPLNEMGDCLFGRVGTDLKRGSLKNELAIYVRDCKGLTKSLAHTKSWNWQQGAMLQWLDKERIIYNDYLQKNNEYVSIIKNVGTGKSIICSRPIYAVSKTSDFALSLNFDRLTLMRPDYGYFNKDINWDEIPNDETDGVWYLDLNKNTSKLILSINQLKSLDPVPSMNNARHKINHIDISPNSKKFIFLHRWKSNSGRYTRLISANCEDGSDIKIVTGDEMVSHNCWWGSHDIISFCRLKDGRDRYVHFNLDRGFVKIIGEDHFQRDGHPSISPDGKWMVTDEYPGLNRFSNLYLYNLKNNNMYLIGEFYRSLKFMGENRIDLHPRWSPDCKYLSIDSGHTGSRQMFLLNVEKIVS